MAKELPLKEITIKELYISGQKCTYEIPIYQRNYAWEKEEIFALVQDAYDAFLKDEKGVYYIGTLVSYNKGNREYEVIDGQQRLTTIRLILGAFDYVKVQNCLTYRARKKSDETLKHIPKFDIDEVDSGIVNGYKHAKSAINDIISDDVVKNRFVQYFLNNVHIIHYCVPKDIDLNHYFEIMNSRGEQLEKHEIVKANLLERLDSFEERKMFNHIWECCSEMNTYIQQNMNDSRVFGTKLNQFLPRSFDEMLNFSSNNDNQQNEYQSMTINEILQSNQTKNRIKDDNLEKKDSFQSIIDFSNFLLIVLKITRMEENTFVPSKFNLDDKELLNEFNLDSINPRVFAYNMLKARYFLDNYVVHHSKEDDTMDSNPWKLQVWQKDNNENGKNKNYPKNLIAGDESNDLDKKYKQRKLVHLLSMFEVSFSARQRKNYLFYCLLFLMKSTDMSIDNYIKFVESLSTRYFYEVYLDEKKLNKNNTPMPGAFDETILSKNTFNENNIHKKEKEDFYKIYGDGTVISQGIPIYIFNYLDYKIWDYYAKTLQGERAKKGSELRKKFFETIGCSDCELDIFKQFYFSRTRKSLEHYYPQASATGKDGALNREQINCFGNYAMIGAEANSMGSNWDPLTKLTHYKNDHSGKIKQISVASIKFVIMMQMCKDEQGWEFKDIEKHQKLMINFLYE